MCGYMPAIVNLQGVLEWARAAVDPEGALRDVHITGGASRLGPMSDERVDGLGVPGDWWEKTSFDRLAAAAAA